MKVSIRLAIGFSLSILLLIICIITAIRTFSSREEKINHMANVQLKKYKSIVDMRRALRELSIATRNVIIYTDSDDINEAENRIQQNKTIFFDNIKILGAMMKKNATPEGVAAMGKILSLEKPMMDAFDNANQLGRINQTQQAADVLKNTVAPVQQQIMDALNDMTQVQMHNVDQAVKDTSSTISGAKMLLLSLAAFSVVASAVAGYVITRTLMRQLGDEPESAQLLAATIAGGDLTSAVALRRNDTTSLLASLSTMQDNLRELVSQIKDSAESVALASDEIAQGNTELSSRTEQQAAALQETAASMEQLTATVKSNTSSAQQTVSSAREAVSLAKTGETDVKNMTETMRDISLSAMQVRDITGIIEGIAFQTNILARNAAVEAARAGEEGRGFAVVAGEVRTLAQRSASAAKEIKELIEKSVELIEGGVAVANRTGQSIMKVVGMVGALEQAMEEISMASTEQMQGISQVTIAVNEMDGVTQSNAALVEESSTASLSLSEQANSLRGIVSSFAV
ncbi:methyl-accepting chemotaxis protein [Pseudescherichia sp.]|uniref:methyl-accepting chemotaxis protein n=1 Tax=Pseudescherichia sp. TaxID=2055881 RepID=UPI00289A0412|nr:methyl-accepting chemotaxis protein [Pseudescherichia sp.]